MRPDIIPGSTFPDYEPDHTDTPRRQSIRRSQIRDVVPVLVERQVHEDLLTGLPKETVDLAGSAGLTFLGMPGWDTAPGFGSRAGSEPRVR